MQDLAIEVVKFLKAEEEKFQSIEEVFKENNFYEEKLKIVRFINDLMNKNKLSRWQIRKLVAEIFEKAGINLETDNIKKVLFLVLTDAVNERRPSPSPLYFLYHNHKIPKRHAIITDFNLYPFLKEKVNELTPEKKHLILFSIWTEGSLIKEGVSYYLSILDYFLFLLLDRALYEELISLNEILKEKNKTLIIDEKNFAFLINILFNGLYQYYTGKKGTLGILSKDKIKYLVKAKKFVKEVLSDEKEEEYLINLAIEDELLSENRKKYLKQEDVQRQIFQEAKQRDVSEIDKIDAVSWLIGLENLVPEVFFEYFSLDDFDSFIPQLEEDIAVDKEKLYEGLEIFLRKLFNNPALYNGKSLNNIASLIDKKISSLKSDFIFWKGDFENFLKQNLKENINSDLKKLYSKYKLGQIDRDEFKNWLTLFEAKEDIDKNLLKFVKNG